MDNISRKQEWLILLAAIVASGMAFLDSSVVNIAIPTIQKSFHASFNSLLWVVNAFPLVLASLLLISGSLSDIFGRKKIFSLGIILFTLASALCGLASSVGMLSVFRGLQGLGAAMMIPGSLTIINLSFPENRRGRAIGLWSGFSGGIAAAGPFIGGFLVQHFSWRAIFFINLPLGILALALTLIAVRESKNLDAKRVDIVGALLVLAGLFGISYGLMTAPSAGFTNPLILGSLIGGTLVLIVFVLVQRNVKNPLVPLSIFDSKLVVGSNLVTLFLYFALNGLIFFVVLNMLQVQGLSPLLGGLALLPAILIITFFSGYGGTVADRIGPRLPMIIGPLFVCVGSIWMIFAGTHANYFISFMPGLILFGAGMAMVIAPLTKSALAVPERFAGSASGVNNAVARTAALLAVAILGVIALYSFADNLQTRISKSELKPEQQQQITRQANQLGGIIIPENFDSKAKDMAQQIVKESFVYSFRIILIITAVLALISSIISAIFIKGK